MDKFQIIIFRSEFPDQLNFLCLKLSLSSNMVCAKPNWNNLMLRKNWVCGFPTCYCIRQPPTTLPNSQNYCEENEIRCKKVFAFHELKVEKYVHTFCGFISVASHTKKENEKMHDARQEKKLCSKTHTRVSGVQNFINELDKHSTFCEKCETSFHMCASA